MDILTGTVGVKKAYDTLIGSPRPGKSGRPGDPSVRLWHRCGWGPVNQKHAMYLRTPHRVLCGETNLCTHSERSAAQREHQAGGSTVVPSPNRRAFRPRIGAHAHCCVSNAGKLANAGYFRMRSAFFSDSMASMSLISL